MAPTLFHGVWLLLPLGAERVCGAVALQVR